MISFVCPVCATAINVDDAAAGKSGKCNKCGEHVRVPAAKKLPKPTGDDADFEQAILGEVSQQRLSNLVPCNDCGQQVSVRAVHCPKCGGPIAAPVRHEPPAKWPQTAKIHLTSLGSIALLLGAFGVVACSAIPLPIGVTVSYVVCLLGLSTWHIRFG